MLAWASCVLCVFQGFTYVLYEGECCGRCLPSACEVVTGSPRGDSQSSWKDVGLGPRLGGREEGSGLASLLVHSAAQCWPWFHPVKSEFTPCPLLSPHGVHPAVGPTQTSAGLTCPLGTSSDCRGLPGLWMWGEARSARSEFCDLLRDLRPPTALPIRGPASPEPLAWARPHRRPVLRACHPAHSTGCGCRSLPRRPHLRALTSSLISTGRICTPEKQTVSVPPVPELILQLWLPRLAT